MIHIQEADGVAEAVGRALARPRMPRRGSVAPVADPIGIGGLIVGVAGIGFGVDQWRRSRAISAQLGRLETYLRERRPEEAAEAAARVSEEAVSHVQRSERNLDEDVRVSPHLREGMTRAIADLPERERLVVTLAFYENLSNAEIATVMGIPAHQVDLLLRRALMKLGMRLRDQVDDDEE